MRFCCLRRSKSGHWNDPDLLQIGNRGMTADEYRTQMSLWSLLHTPLIAGNDLHTMTSETKSILMNSEIIAIDQDPAACLHAAHRLMGHRKFESVLWPTRPSQLVRSIGPCAGEDQFSLE